MSNERSGGFFGRFIRTLLLGVIALSLGSMAFKLFFPNSISAGSDNQIAIVEVTGMIASSKDIVRQLKEYRENDNIKGIILRIDSPGGSVGPSQEIYDEVIKVKSSNKKIFASLGSMAASGGYYIASPADMIIANPGTLTGSIGVIMAFSNIEELIKKIGMRPEVIKSGKFKDSGSPTRPMLKSERKLFQSVVDDVHEQFMEAVADGRNLPKKQVKTIADGRIFTGRQALKLKMVDHLGGLEKSIELMAEAVGIKGNPVIVQETENVGMLDFLLRSYFPHKLSQSLMQGPTPNLQYLWTAP